MFGWLFNPGIASQRFSLFDGNPPTAYKLQFRLSKRFVHYDCSLPEVETSRALNMSQHVHARLSHFVTNGSFCMQRLDSMKEHLQSCEEMRQEKKKEKENCWGSICHFSPVTCASDVYADWWRIALTLLLTSTKTKQFAWNDWWVLICWEQQTQQMSVLRSKLFFIFFKISFIQKLSKSNETLMHLWEVGIGGRRRLSDFSSAGCWLLHTCPMSLPWHDEVPHCNLLSAQSSLWVFLSYGSGSLQSHCGPLLKGCLCLTSVTYGIQIRLQQKPEFGVNQPHENTTRLYISMYFRLKKNMSLLLSGLCMELHYTASFHGLHKMKGSHQI